MELIKNIDVNRISWSAIFAGVIITFAGESLLNLLGLGLGLTAFRVDADVITNIGISSIIWLILSGIVCMFIGGWVASRLANISHSIEGILHGLVAWGLTILLTFLLISTTAGNLISGATNSIGKVFSLTSSSVTTAKNMMPNMDSVLEKIKKEADQLLVENNGNVQEPGKTSNSEGKPPSSEKIQSDLQDYLTAFLTSTNENESTNARQQLIDFLKNKGMEQFQAEQKVNQWQQNYTLMKEDLKEKAVAATEQVSTALGKAALMTFFMFLLSGVAGAVGGMMGLVNRRKNISATDYHD